jgi:hypothetical protein
MSGFLPNSGGYLPNMAGDQARAALRLKRAESLIDDITISVAAALHPSNIAASAIELSNVLATIGESIVRYRSEL